MRRRRTQYLCAARALAEAYQWLSSSAECAMGHLWPSWPCAIFRSKRGQGVRMCVCVCVVKGAVSAPVPLSRRDTLWFTGHSMSWRWPTLILLLSKKVPVLRLRRWRW